MIPLAHRWVPLLAAVVLFGCAGPPHVKESDFKVLHRVRFAAGTGTALDLTDLFPIESGRRVYRVIGGTDAGEWIIHRRAAGPITSMTWIDVPGGQRQELWRRVGSAVELLTVVESSDRAVTFFDPPLVVATTAAGPGAPFEQTVDMRVGHIEDPSKTRESGIATQRIEIIGTAVVETTYGRFTTTVVRVTFKADLRMADALTRTTLYVVRGQGPLAIEQQERVTAFGFPVRDVRRVLLIESPRPNPPDGVEGEAGAETTGEGPDFAGPRDGLRGDRPGVVEGSQR